MVRDPKIALENIPFYGIIASSRKRSAFAGRDWRPADHALFLRKEKETLATSLFLD